MAISIKETSYHLRPYEKCLKYGAEVLTDEELLAVIIRSGTKDENSVALSQRILSFSNPDNGLLNLYQLSINQLIQIKGIGKVKAIQLKCIAELSTRIAKASYTKRHSFTSPKAVADYYMESLRHCQREVVMALMLDSSSNYLGEYKVSVGTINSSLVSPREIFIEALNMKAVYIILIHNHPSGNPTPSNQDIALTKNIISAGEIIGIRILDHIIIGDNTYISLKEKNLLY